MPSPEYIERRLNELRAMWETPEIFKQRSPLSQKLIRQIEAERSGAPSAPAESKTEVKKDTPHNEEQFKEVTPMTDNIIFRSSPDNAPIHLDEEASASTRGYTPLRLPRPPMENVSSTGVDVVFVKDIPNFLRGRLKESIKYEGTTRATTVFNHYRGVLKQAKVLDSRTMNDLDTMSGMLDAAGNHEARKQVFEDKIDRYFKETSTATTEG